MVVLNDIGSLVAACKRHAGAESGKPFFQFIPAYRLLSAALNDIAPISVADTFHKVHPLYRREDTLVTFVEQRNLHSYIINFKSGFSRINCNWSGESLLFI